jgi:hypothetical protein
VKYLSRSRDKKMPDLLAKITRLEAENSKLEQIIEEMPDVVPDRVLPREIIFIARHWIIS